MQIRIAVAAVIGSSPRTRPATGVTAATGSCANRMIRSPIEAFQKLITVHGSVIAKHATRRASSTPNPPTDSASAQSQLRPRIERPTSAKNSACRPASDGAGAGVTIGSGMERSSMEGLMFASASRYSGARPGKSMTGGQVSKEESQALWYVEPGRAELRGEPLSAPAAGELRLRALFGGISRGTERLVFNGRVPASEFERMRG